MGFTAVVLVLLQLATLSPAQTVAGYPPCRDYGYCSVIDIGIAFTGWPVGLNPNITRLDFTGHPIGFMFGTELHPFENLDTLLMTQSAMTVVPPHLFGKNLLLRVVYMNIMLSLPSSPGISTLPVQLFENNSLLETVVLSSDGLISLPGRIFHKNPQLSTILARSNALISIFDRMFEAQRAAEIYIDLSRNSITTLGPVFLDGLSGRQFGAIQLNLERNALLTMPHRIPLNISLSGLLTNPGVGLVTCSRQARGTFDVVAQPGVVSSFCTYDCTPCNGSEYPHQLCSSQADNHCSPLPSACINSGQCAGLNLSDVPMAISPSVTALDLSDNLIFAVDMRALRRLPLLEAGANNFSANPMSTACLPQHIFNNAVGACVHDCSSLDSTYCPEGSAAYIRWNCTATLAAVCETCSTTPCLLSGRYTTSNCTLYTPKRCATCTACTASTNTFIATDCTEYTNRVCKTCSSCGTQEYMVADCAAFTDRKCGACDASCNSCFGGSTTHCRACNAGFVAIDAGDYGGVPGVMQCVPYEQCRYSTWGNWSSCTADCGGGSSSRRRATLNTHPCSSPLEIQELQDCNMQQCTVPTLSILLTVSNVTVESVNSTQLINITTLVQNSLLLPLSSVVLVSIVNVEHPAEATNSNGTLNATHYGGVVMKFQAKLKTVAQLQKATVDAPGQLSSIAFQKALSKILGVNVTVSVLVLAVLPLIPPPGLPFGILAAAGVVGLLFAHALSFTVWYRCKSNQNFKQVEARRAHLSELIAALQLERTTKMIDGLKKLPKPVVRPPSRARSRMGLGTPVSRASRLDGVDPGSATPPTSPVSMFGTDLALYDFDADSSTVHASGRAASPAFGFGASDRNSPPMMGGSGQAGANVLSVHFLAPSGEIAILAATDAVQSVNPLDSQHQGDPHSAAKAHFPSLAGLAGLNVALHHVSAAAAARKSERKHARLAALPPDILKAKLLRHAERATAKALLSPEERAHRHAAKVQRRASRLASRRQLSKLSRLTKSDLATSGASVDWLAQGVSTDEEAEFSELHEAQLVASGRVEPRLEVVSVDVDHAPSSISEPELPRFSVNVVA